MTAHHTQFCPGFVSVTTLLQAGEVSGYKSRISRAGSVMEARQTIAGARSILASVHRAEHGYEVGVLSGRSRDRLFPENSSPRHNLRQPSVLVCSSAERSSQLPADRPSRSYPTARRRFIDSRMAHS